MAKLYFKYGAMGSSKSAQALTTKFNYEEKGMTVWLIKPGTDTRDGADIIRSRIGLQQQAQVIHPDDDIIKAYARSFRVIILLPFCRIACIYILLVIPLSDGRIVLGYSHLRSRRALPENYQSDNACYCQKTQ